MGGESEYWHPDYTHPISEQSPYAGAYHHG
jgi:hypothetical protein